MLPGVPVFLPLVGGWGVRGAMWLHRIECCCVALLLLEITVLLLHQLGWVGPHSSPPRGPPRRPSSPTNHSPRILRFDSFIPPAPRSSTPGLAAEDEGEEGCGEARATAEAVPGFASLPRGLQQHLLYRHCRHFPLLIDAPRTCGRHSHQAPYLLLAIKSRVHEFGRRELVRRTWGAEGLVGPGGGGVGRVFLLGTPVDSHNTSFWGPFLRLESRTHGDLLQWGFHDTFLNLTLKATSFLHWFSSRCAGSAGSPGISFVLHCDSDMLVNVHNALRFLRMRRPHHHLLAGDVMLAAHPVRDPRSKYYVPTALYGPSQYPAYAGGGALLASRRTTLSLAAIADSVEIFPIDDVFLGMCLQRLGVAPEPHAGFRTLGLGLGPGSGGVWGDVAERWEEARCLLRGLVAVHGLTVEQVWLAHAAAEEEEEGRGGEGCGRRAAVVRVAPEQWWRID